jgi:hypothetical protein
MNLIKKILGKVVATAPVEPIFPNENFTIFRVNMPEGLSFATVNTGYRNYHNKKCYPFLVAIELEILEKNNNGHPTDIDAQRLNEIQENVESLLKQQQTVHPLARVTRNGTRDIMMYIDKPVFSEKELTGYCDNIRKERKIVFSIQKDEKWNAVSGFLQ